MAYLAQPTSKTEYGVVTVGDFINVLDGLISLEQDVSPDASVSFSQVTIDGEVAVTSVTPSSGDGIELTDVVSTGNETSFTISNTGVLSLTAGDGVSISASTGNITISASGADLIATIGVTGSYTATANDEYIGVYSAAAVTISLPVGVTGRVYTIKDEYGQGSGKITIKPFGTEKIDNAVSYIISVPNQSVSVVFRGGQWRII
jgi:hypothetical protein